MAQAHTRLLFLSPVAHVIAARRGLECPSCACGKEGSLSAGGRAKLPGKGRGQPTPCAWQEEGQSWAAHTVRMVGGSKEVQSCPCWTHLCSMLRKEGEPDCAGTPSATGEAPYIAQPVTIQKPRSPHMARKKKSDVHTACLAE